MKRNEYEVWDKGAIAALAGFLLISLSFIGGLITLAIVL